MAKVVRNTTTTPLTVFAHLAIPVGSLDLAEAAAEALGRDPVIAALMDAGLVSIEEREEPAADAGAGFQAVEPEAPAADGVGNTEVISSEPINAPETEENSSEAAPEVIAPADLPQSAALPPEAPAEGDSAEPAPAEPKVDKPASKKMAAKT